MQFLARGNRAKYIASVVAGLALIGFGGYCLEQYHFLSRQTKAPSSLQQIVAKVALLYPVPKDEVPTLAQVQNTSELMQQPFFKDAQAGDDVLIYQKNKLAIVYRPGANAIVNSGTAVINSLSSDTSATPSHFSGVSPLPSTTQ